MYTIGHSDTIVNQGTANLSILPALAYPQQDVRSGGTREVSLPYILFTTCRMIPRNRQT
jgi:hypothetical protein